MSKHIHNLKVGDELEIKGPIPKYNWDENVKDNVGMIAGGTGITPMVSNLDKGREESRN
jgi:cytochrome-b5 reductase